jgi:outer membrane lipoprotein-sorting protein
MKRFIVFALSLACLATSLPAKADPPLDAALIMQRVEARNPSLKSFRARVHVHAHMLTFPWLSPNLEGTSYFKSPDNYEVVFDRVPSYAHGIDKLFGDIADPAAWRKDSDIVFDGVKTIDGHPLLALRITKKIRSDQIKDTVAYVDPALYQVVRMEYRYVDGGVITMTQTFRSEGPYSVVATQHADIHHRVHAVADASFGAYELNVALADSVFKKAK